MKKETIVYIGIDISKETLDLFAKPSHQPLRAQLPNNNPGFRKLIAWLTQHQLPPHGLHFILEATGVYHEALVHFLDQHKLPFSVVNPRLIRDFARSTGLLAKTDRLDAEVLMRYGEVMAPDPTQLPSPILKDLAALVNRRTQLLDMLLAETNRLEGERSPRLLKSIKAHIKQLEKQIEQIEEDIRNLLQSDESLKGKLATLQTIQGIGEITAWSLLAYLPELGQINRR